MLFALIFGFVIYLSILCFCFFFFFFKQKTAYEMRISDWSSDVCSSDLFRERLTFPDSPRIRESRCKRPQLNFVSYLLKELTAPAALPLFRRFLEGEGH